jgi:hypothetical protein
MPLQVSRFFLATNGFVAILKKMPVAAMLLVEAYGMASQKAAHDRCNRHSSGTQQWVSVVAQQRPCIAGGVCLGEQRG